MTGIANPAGFGKVPSPVDHRTGGANASHGSRGRKEAPAASGRQADAFRQALGDAAVVKAVASPHPERASRTHDAAHRGGAHEAREGGHPTPPAATDPSAIAASAPLNAVAATTADADAPEAADIASASNTTLALPVKVSVATTTSASAQIASDAIATPLSVRVTARETYFAPPARFGVSPPSAREALQQAAIAPVPADDATDDVAISAATTSLPIAALAAEATAGDDDVGANAPEYVALATAQRAGAPTAFVGPGTARRTSTAAAATATGVVSSVAVEAKDSVAVEANGAVAPLPTIEASPADPSPLEVQATQPGMSTPVLRPVLASASAHTPNAGEAEVATDATVPQGAPSPAGDRPSLAGHGTSANMAADAPSSVAAPLPAGAPTAGAVQDIAAAVGQAVTQLPAAASSSVRATAPVAASGAAETAGPVRVVVLRVDLGDLGGINVRVGLVGRALSVRLEAEKGATAGLLREQHDKLAEVLRRDGYDATVQIGRAVPTDTGAPAGQPGGDARNPAQQQQPSVPTGDGQRQAPSRDGRPDAPAPGRQPIPSPSDHAPADRGSRALYV